MGEVSLSECTKKGYPQHVLYIRHFTQAENLMIQLIRQVAGCTGCSSVVNALSIYMDVKISMEGAIHHDRYERGIPVVELENGLLPVIGKTRKTGTEVNFLPDDTIFEKTRFKAEEVKSRLHETAYLNPNLTIIFEDRRGAQTEHIEYHEEDGILGFIRDLNQKKEAIHERFILKVSQKELKWKLYSSM